MNPAERGYFESRLTDLLLGELTAEEAAELRQAIAQDAELAAAFERLKKTVSLVRESASVPEEQAAAQPAPLRLTNDRRQKLLAHFKTVELKVPAPKRRWFEVRLVEMAAVIAILGILAAMVAPSLQRAKEKARFASRRANPVSYSYSLGGKDAGSQDAFVLSQATKREQPAVVTIYGPRQSAAPATDLPTAVTNAIYLPGNTEVASFTFAPSFRGEAGKSAGISGSGATLSFDGGTGNFSTGIPRSDAGSLRYLYSDASLGAAPAHSIAPTLSDRGGSLALGGVAGNSVLDNSANANSSFFKLETSGNGSLSVEQSAPGFGGYQLNTIPGATFPVSASAIILPSAEPNRDVAQVLAGDKAELETVATPALAQNAPPRPEADKVDDAERNSKESLDEKRDAQRKQLAKGTPAQVAEAELPKEMPAASPPVETKSNDVDAALPRKPAPAPIPQPEIQTRDNAFSTFSLNVSDVSFKLAAASLEKGVMPEPAAIRAEEFINAFNYRDPEPAAGAPVAFVAERARYPFAHNRDLLRFSIKTAAAGRQSGRPLNLVLLLDNSGSMERADRVRIIQQALRVLAGQLQPQDKLSVVTFARTASLRLDGLSGKQAADALESLSGLTPQGGTNLEDAMNLAYATALRHYLAGGINRVVLLTDGAANLGNVDPATLKQKVEANRKQGVALDCFGIGWEGYNDDLLEVLSRNGDGRYGFINSPEEAATEFAAQLAGALKVAASDVKVQVEFNPKRVVSYRQLGYAKHQLTKEQFRDNTVDAAEIAAAESGNALYTIETNPAGEGPVCTVRVRYKVPATADYREQEWTVPFTGTAVSLDQAGPALRLAATAGAFSEWLASSPFAAEVTPDKLLNQLGTVPEVYGADARPKKLEWMIRQANSLSGK